jgi:SRSO17 transposase
VLPRCRLEGEPFTIATFDLHATDVTGFLEELQEFQSLFHDCFARSEARSHFQDYMVGQCSPLARKSIEPMACKVEGSQVRCLQRFVSETAWDDEQLRWTSHHLVDETMGDAEGVLLFDESGVVKKGRDSAGVARQYCGSVGKVENSQVGVFAGYASRQGYALLDAQLFLPEVWFEPTHEVRRTKCQVPPEVTFQTKPQLAAAMLRRISQDGLLSFRYIVADSVYGNSPEFWTALDACVGTTALVAISSETRCWVQRPPVQTKTYRYQGAERTKSQVHPAVPAPQSVAALAASLPSWRWYRRTVSVGTKGPIVYDVARQRVTLCKETLPERTVWLVVKRTLGPEPTYAYAVSNAPASLPFRTLLWLSSVRWAIEQCFEECKTELGMAHYEVRKYAGWHHHMMLTMLAHFFLWHLKVRLGEKSPGSHRVTTAAITGGRLAHADVYDTGNFGADRVGATAQSPSLSLASETTGDRRLKKVAL